jgi:hypothetical protein
VLLKLARVDTLGRIVVGPDSAGSEPGPVCYGRGGEEHETVRGRLMRLGSFEAASVNRLFAEMRAEAEAIVRRGAPAAKLVEQRSAFMRYRGQGHEIAVALPVRDLTAADRSTIRELFEAVYRRLYSRALPEVEIEILSWVVAVSAPSEGQLGAPARERPSEPKPASRRPIFDPDTGEFEDVGIYWRPDLAPGARISGPALIAEAETSIPSSKRRARRRSSVSARCRRVLIATACRGGMIRILWTLKQDTGPGGVGVRQYPGMAYDSSRGRTVLFAGLGNLGSRLNDTWEWDGENWTQVADTGGPPGPVYEHPMVYDAQRNKTVLYFGFGGLNGTSVGYFADTWEHSEGP